MAFYVRGAWVFDNDGVSQFRLGLTSLCGPPNVALNTLPSWPVFVDMPATAEAFSTDIAMTNDILTSLPNCGMSQIRNSDCNPACQLPQCV